MNAGERLAASEANLLDEHKTSELREQLIGVLGHDLRNPLASIDAETKMLLKEPLSPNGSAIVGSIQNSVGRVAELIDNVLDFAHGRLGSGLTLERVIKTQLAVTKTVSCHRARMAQLLSNLEANAITHGASEEPIVVHAATRDGSFEISVANQGEPIPASTLERLFQPFFRVAARPSQHGLGPGLYIASEIARAHGGSLNVISNQEETRFTFRMPLA